MSSDDEIDELAATAATQNVLRVGVRGRLMDSLPALQNAIKRDAESYKEEFRQQFNHFQAELGIFKLQPNRSAKQSKTFSDLITFISHVAPCYPDHCKDFPAQLLELLDTHASALDPDLRRSIVNSLILLRNRDFISPLSLLPALFQLFKCHDRALRTLVFQHIIGDISRVNAKSKHNKLNTSLQNYLYSVLKDTESPTAVKKSLDVMVELYRRNVWKDAKTVNVISTACFHKEYKIVATALRFFLGITTAEDEDDDEEDKSVALKKLKAESANLKHSKLHKKRQRKLDRSMEKIKKSDHGDAADAKTALGGTDVGAIRMIYDPTSFTEKLFGMLKGGGQPFELKLLLMNTISRFIGCHKLFVLNFYPFLQKYMQPAQRNVTAILVYLAQATHELVPPDVLEPCVRTLANQFVTERCTGEVMTVGLNAIRELCARQPLSMDATLLQDLAQYKTHRDKGVMMAARSLIALYREHHPEMLHRRDRGKEATMTMSAKVASSSSSSSSASSSSSGADSQYLFGAQRVVTDVPGAEFLKEDHRNDNGSDNEEEDDSNDADEDGWNKSDEERGSDEDSDEDDDEIVFSDDDEEEDDDDEDEYGDENSAAAKKKKKHRMRALAAKDEENEEDEEDDDDEDEDDEHSSGKTPAEYDFDMPEHLERKLKRKQQRLARKAKAQELDSLLQEVKSKMDEDEDEESSKSSSVIGKKRKDVSSTIAQGKEDVGDEDEEEEDDNEEDEDEEEEDDNEEDGDDDEDDESNEEEDDDDEEMESDHFHFDSSSSATSSSSSSSSPHIPFAATKIFTPKDFEMMKMAQARAAAAKLKGKRSRYTGEDETVKQTMKQTGNEVLDSLTIEGYHGKKRAEYAERLASTLSGRREFQGKQKGGGSTNEEKLRTKNFQMIKHTHKVRRKAKRTVSRRTQVTKKSKEKNLSKHQKKRRF